MVRKTITVLIAVFAFITMSAIAQANVSTIPAGKTGICENAGWQVNNLSETADTKISFDIGPHGYSWGKTYTRTIPAGGFLGHALAKKTTFKNSGPGAVSLNCQRKRFDDHDWKIDAGSGKTYQPDYHMDHVQPRTYIEPGLGMPEGTERGIGGVTGRVSESNR